MGPRRLPAQSGLIALCRAAMCVVLGWALWHAGALARESSSALLGAREQVRVLGAAEVSMLRDPGGALGIDQITAPAMAAKFKPQAGGLSLRYTNDAVWVRIAVQRQALAPDHWRLELTSAVLNDVRLFIPKAGSGHEVLQAGDRYAFAERQQAWRRPVFALWLPDDQPRVFYLRIHTDSAIFTEFVLQQVGAFEAKLQFESLWMGEVLGVALISMLFFLQAWFVNRDRLLLAAAGVTLAFLLTASTNLGLLSQYVLPRHPLLADALHPVSMALFISPLAMLFGRALDLGAHFPRMARLHVVVTALCVSAAALRLLDLYADIGGLLMMAGLLFCLGWITVGAWMVWRLQRRGLLTAVALSVCTTSLTGAPMTALGLLPPSIYWDAYWVVGCVGFMLLAQFATLDEVRKARAFRRAAERLAEQAELRADQELASRRQQAMYFAGVAHDLRTPLSAVRVGLANLERSLGGASGDSRQRMARLQTSAQRASEMIERHLQLQRLDQPDVELMLEDVELAHCLEQVRSAIVEAWPGREFRLQLHPGTPGVATLDAELVERALTNLLANAAKASAPGNAIDLDVRGDGHGGVCFEVRDRGPGLGDVAFEHLLQMHWRRNSAEPRGAGDQAFGFGIGLPVVARIAALHQGRLEYRREAGSTVFSLWLPGPSEGDLPSSAGLARQTPAASA